MSNFLAASVFLLFLVAAPVCCADQRIAILPSGKAGETLAGLLTAELGQRTNIAMVERAELNRVWREQTITDLTSASAMKAGTLLNAQAMVALEAQQTTKGFSARLRLIGVHSGAVLGWWEYTIPAAQVSSWATLAANRLEEIAAKLNVESPTLARVSFVGFTSPTESRESKILQREINGLFLNRLGRERSLIVLEREKLLEASLEKILGDDDRKFWNGGYILDGTINPRELANKKVEVQVRLSSPGKAEPALFSISGKQEDLVRLAEQFAEGVRKAINTGGRAVEWDPKVEGKRFLDEAQLALRAGLWREAATATDTAIALGYDTQEARLLRLEAYTGFITPDYRESSARAIKPIFDILDSYTPGMSAEALRECVDAAYQLKDFSDSAQLSGAVLRPAVGKAIEALGNVGNLYYHAVELRLGHEDELDQLRQTMREVVSAYVEKCRSSTTGSGPTRVTDEWIEFLGRLCHYAPLWAETLEQGLELHRLFHSLSVGYHVEEIAENSTKFTPVPQLCGWKWSDRERAKNVWKSYQAELRLLSKASGQLQSIGRAGTDLAVKAKVAAALDFFRAEQAPLSQSGFCTGFGDALNLVWNQQAELIAPPIKAGIMNSELASLKQTLAEIDRSTAGHRAPLFTAFDPKPSRPVDRLALSLSRGVPPPTNLVSLSLWLTPEEKLLMRELLPKVNDLPDSEEKRAIMPQVDRMIVHLDRQLTPRKFAPPGKVIPQPSNPSAPPPGQSLAASAVHLATPLANAERVQWAANSFWIFQKSSGYREYYDADGRTYGSKLISQYFLSQFDPATARIEHVEIPNRYFTLQQQAAKVEFVIFSNRLIFLLESGLLIYDRQAQSFDLEPAPIFDGHLFQFGTNLLVYNSDTILGRFGSNKGFEVLASVRRRPPRTPLDSLSSYEGGAFLTNKDLDIALTLPTVAFMFADSKWTSLSPEQVGTFGTSSLTYNSFAGTEYEGPLPDGKFSLAMPYNRLNEAVLTLTRSGSTNSSKVQVVLPGRTFHGATIPNSNVTVAGGHLFLWSPNSPGFWWISSQQLSSVFPSN